MSINTLPNKRFKYLVLLLLPIILSLVVLQLYFQPGFPYTHDGENHLARFANYKIALLSGQLPPRLAPNLMNHYGYPVFNYNYPLANMLSLPLSLAGVNYELTFKLLVFASLAFGGLGVILWLKNYSKSDRILASALLAYYFTPFLFNTLNFRGNIGEIMAYCLAPWLFYTIEKITRYKQLKLSWWLSMIFVWSAFLLAHNITVLFAGLIIGFFALSQLKSDLEKWRQLISILLPALGLSLWFWLPAVAEMGQVILGQASLQSQYLDHFPTLAQLLYSPLRFGFSYPGQVDSLSFWLGWLGLMVLFLFTLVFMVRYWQKRQKLNLSLSFFWLLALLSFVLQLSFTKDLWRAVEIGRFIQFPWRLSFWFSLASLPLLVWLLKQHLKWLSLLLGLVLGLQILVLLQTKPLEYFHKTSLEYDLFSQSTTTQNENLPTSFLYTEIGEWQPTPQIIKGDGEIVVNSWVGSNHHYLLALYKPSIIVEPSMYFLGWQTSARRSVDSPWQLLDYYDDPAVGGRIAYRLPAGVYQVKTVFTQQTPARMVSHLVFIITLLLVGWQTARWAKRNTRL